MPKYVIERELPGAGGLNDDDLMGISQKSNSVLDDTRVREHASRGGFPANAVRPVASVIDPTTGGL